MSHKARLNLYIDKLTNLPLKARLTELERAVDQLIKAQRETEQRYWKRQQGSSSKLLGKSLRLLDLPPHMAWRGKLTFKVTRVCGNKVTAQSVEPPKLVVTAPIERWWVME